MQLYKFTSSAPVVYGGGWVTAVMVKVSDTHRVFGVWERNSSHWGTVFSWPLCSVKTWGFPSVNHFAHGVVTPLGLQQRRSKHSLSPPLSWWHMVLVCSSPSPHPKYLNKCFIIFHQSTWRTCPHLFFHPLCLTAIHISFPMWPDPWYFSFILPVTKPLDSSLIFAADRYLQILTVHTEPKKLTLRSVFCTGSLWFPLRLNKIST